MDYYYEIIFNGKYSGKLYKVYENDNKEFVEDIIVRGNRYHINENREVVENKYKILRCRVCNKMIVSFNKNVKYCSKECNEASKDERGIECMKMFKESYYNALNKAKELAENKSELSGKKGKLVVHHLNSYNKDLSGRCDVANMVVLLEEEHKAFHKKYGYGNNSVEQFEEFMQDYIHA